MDHPRVRLLHGHDAEHQQAFLAGMKIDAARNARIYVEEYLLFSIPEPARPHSRTGNTEQSAILKPHESTHDSPISASSD